MRCPVCHSDTISTLPRCTRCNAPLPAQPEQPHDPWAAQQHDPWATPQQEIWHPPPPKRRNQMLPYLLTALGVVLLTALALGIIFWPGGNRSSNEPPPTPAVTEETQTPASTTPTGTASDDAALRQATAIDDLLTSMASTRSRLSDATDPYCDADALGEIRDQREDQLARAEALDVGELADGAELKDALERALRASIESNEIYLAYAPECPDSAAESANNRATQAKSEFVDYWNPIAAEHDLPSRDPGAI